MAGGGFGPGPGNGKGKEYPGNLTMHVIVTCVVAAMGGLIFGYDIGISGTCFRISDLLFLLQIIRILINLCLILL